MSGFRTVPLALQTSDITAQAFAALSDKMSTVARGYRGGPWLFEFPPQHRGETIVQQSAAMLQYVFIHNVLWPIALRFVKLPQPFEAPQPQEICVPRSFINPEDVRPLMAEALIDPRTLTPEEWGRLRVGDPVSGGSEFTRRVFAFPHPFAGSFAHGMEYFNLQHPTVQWLVKFAAAATAGGGINAAHASPAGLAVNWIRFLRTSNVEICYETLELSWRSLPSIVTGLATIADQPIPPCPKFEEFVAGSLSRTKREVFERKQTQQPFNLLTEEPWGYDYQE